MFQDKGEPALEQLHGGLSATRANLGTLPSGILQATLAALGPISKLVQVEDYHKNIYISQKYICLSPKL